MTSRELLAARETIEVLRRNQAGGVVAEVPAFDPGLAAVGALPVAVTDELIPGFLLTEQESGGTDPLLRVEGQGPPEDADERPGLDRSAPATQPDRPSVMAFQRRTQPDLAVLRGRLADDAHDDEEAP